MKSMNLPKMSTVKPFVHKSGTTSDEQCKNILKQKFDQTEPNAVGYVTLPISDLLEDFTITACLLIKLNSLILSDFPCFSVHFIDYDPHKISLHPCIYY